MTTKGGLFEQLKNSWLSIGGRRHQEAEAPAERRTVDRRREPRVTLRRVDGVVPAMAVRHAGKEYELHNLAVRGFGIRLTGAEDLGARVHERLEVELVIGETAIPMTARVVSRDEQVIGFEILAADPAWQTMVVELLDPLLLGKQLREIDPRFVTPDRKGNRARWFQGGPACDLFIWYDPSGTFLGAQLFFLGQVVDWSVTHGIRTGVVAADIARERAYAQVELFNLRQPGDVETLLVARRLLATADLPDEIRALVVC